jgi:hypothetical protein
MTVTPLFRFLAAGATLTLVYWPRSAFSDESVRIEERFASGDQYSVKARSEVSGTLTPPAEKGKPTPPAVTLRGDSAIEYDERVLTVAANGQVQKTLRISRRVDFQRTVDERPEKSSLRPAVRRLVLLREGPLRKAPFSPDGPLTWGEIDIIRTDVFVPALAGLFPADAVKPGDSWSASAEAVQELTGLAAIDEGRLECRLEQVSKRQARVALSGSVRGMTEDGTSRQQVKGYFLFDLDARRLVYVELRGVHSLLGTDGHEVGRIDGRFVLSRQPDTHAPELGDDALRGVNLVPNADNTLLLYDNADLGVRFLYPRRWKVAGSGGNQVAVDAPDGSGFLLTVEPASRTPTAAQFLKESADILEKEKGKILRVDPPQTVQTNPPREHFALEVDMGGQKFVMDYHVSRQTAGGVILAARLLPASREELQRELDAIARTVVLTKRP